MIVVPASNPITTPAVFTEAIEVVQLLQVPPLIASDKAVVAPKQIPVLPVIADVELTVMIRVTAQPAPNE